MWPKTQQLAGKSHTTFGVATEATIENLNFKSFITSLRNKKYIKSCKVKVAHTIILRAEPENKIKYCLSP